MKDQKITRYFDATIVNSYVKETLMTRLLTACVLLAMAQVATAATITVGDHLLLPNQPNQVISILVSGGDTVNAINLYAQVGDGGPELADYGLPAGTPGPAITSSDLKAGIFSAFSESQTDPGSIPQVQVTSLFSAMSTATADGVLVTLNMDTTGFFSGTWDLLLSGVLPFAELGGPFDTDFAPTPAIIYNGSITIVPEPGSVALLLIGACAMAVCGLRSKRIRRG